MADHAATVEQLQGELRRVGALHAAEVAGLREALDRSHVERDEALEQQTATSEILRVIASSPSNINAALQTIAETAHRLSASKWASIRVIDGDRFAIAAVVGDSPRSFHVVGMRIPIATLSPSAEAVRLGQTVHTADVQSEEMRTQYPGTAHDGQRTTLHVPLMRGGRVIGLLSQSRVIGLLSQSRVIGLLSQSRDVVAPYSGTEIALLETFADQAVIAIENARLFEELEQRNRDLNEALEQQTAMAEVLRVIASSPTDLSAVLQRVTEAAARYCGADNAMIQRRDGDYLLAAALSGSFYTGQPDYLATTRIPITRGTFAGRAALDRETLYIADIEVAGDEFAEGRAIAKARGWRSGVFAPLLKGEGSIGVLVLISRDVNAFAHRQIELVETFADQAVIAIENARLFEELEGRNIQLQESNRQVTEALEQQSATAEILRVIASSPTDLQAVLDTLCESAARLAGADRVVIHRLHDPRGDVLWPSAEYGTPTAVGFHPRLGQREVNIPINAGSPTGRVVRERRVMVVGDMLALSPEDFPDAARIQAATGHRSMVSTPLLSKGEPIGVLNAMRMQVRPFGEREVMLLASFADQAVIAIENARLFQDLTEALEQQTATAEALKVISRSAFDLQPVLDTLVEHAARLCGAPKAVIYRVENDQAFVAATYNMPTAAREVLRESLERAGTGHLTARVMLWRRTVHIPDPLADPDYTFAELLRVEGIRTMLGVPMLRDGRLLGTIGMWKNEVAPFTPRQIQLVETFADQAVIAIENTRLFETLNDRVGELQALGEIGQAVSSSLDVQEVLTTIVAHAVELSGTHGGVIYEYDETDGQLHLRATRLFDADLTAALRAAPFSMGEGAAGRAAATRAPVQIDDILAEGAYESHVREAMAGAGHRALLALPLLREGRILGSLVVSRKATGAFPDETVSLLQTFATQSALAIHNAWLYQQLAVQGRALEEASRHKSQFLANMSHELRTPLNAIIGYSEMLQEEAEERDAEAFLPDLRRINAAGKHLLGLINDVLDLSKIEAGRMDLFLETFDVRQMVRDVHAIVQPLIEKNGNTLVVTCPGDLGTMHADQTKLRQALFNLLSNAAKFTERGTIELRVDLTPPTPLSGAERGESDSLLPLSCAERGPGVRSPSPSPTPGSG